MFSMCLLTVRGEMPSRRAIAWAIRPLAIRLSTASSRAVSRMLMSGLGALGAGPVTRSRRA